jgi:3-hydroxyacyl-[acyl-carrier-protein] dehydratase
MSNLNVEKINAESKESEKLKFENQKLGTAATTGINGQVSLDFKRVCELLPHRAPFILVDRIAVADFEKMEIEGIKCVSALDPYFQGHFPGNPVFPGVYLIEGMAQTSALLCFEFFDRMKFEYDRTCLLTGVSEAKFRQPVVPGQVIHYHCRISRSRGQFVWFEGVSKVDGKIVAEASFSSVLSGPVPQMVKNRMP